MGVVQEHILQVQHLLQESLHLDDGLLPDLSGRLLQPINAQIVPPAAVI